MKLYGNYTPEISEISDDVVWFVWDGAGGITGPIGYNFPGSWKVYEAEDIPAARAAGMVPAAEYIAAVKRRRAAAAAAQKAPQ